MMRVPATQTHVQYFQPSPNAPISTMTLWSAAVNVFTYMLCNLFHPSGAVNLKLRLRWIDPADDNKANDVNLNIVPSVNYEGSPCDAFIQNLSWLVPGSSAGTKL